MNKIQVTDIMPTDDYNRIRDEYRQRMLDVKKNRRVGVGEYLMFLFENADTMKYQIQEMVRIEQIQNPEAIQHEIDTYNELVPDRDEISASLLIELDDPQARAFKLRELVGLQDSVSMLIDKDYQIHAEFDDRQITDGKISSVHYIKFPLGEKAADAFLSTESVEILGYSFWSCSRLQMVGCLRTCPPCSYLSQTTSAEL